MTEKVYTKPPHWAEPKNELVPHQVGFTSPPRDWDAAPSDFLHMAPRTVGVHGRMLHAPDRVRQVHRRMKPHYDHLFRYRLKFGD